MTADQVLEKYGKTQKQKLDDSIGETINDTVNAEDALEYMDDIVDDFETDNKVVLSEEDEESLCKYIESEIRRRAIEGE